MQVHAPEAAPGHFPVQLETPVSGVADDRTAGMGQVDTDLMGAPGLEPGLHQREFTQWRQLEAQQAGHPGQRLLTAGAHADAAIAVRCLVTMKREGQHTGPQRPAAGDDRQVTFVGSTFAPLRMQGHQRGPPPREQQHARGFAIEPMHQFEKARLRARRA